MAMSYEQFLEYMHAKYPHSKKDNALNVFGNMYDLAETDEGMKDLLDRAFEYYLLKREL